MTLDELIALGEQDTWDVADVADWQDWTGPGRLLPLLREFAQAREAQAWQPIETAPKSERVFWWIVPKTAEESYCDSSGAPIVSTYAPFRREGRWGSWSVLSKAIYWMPLPPAPARSAEPAKET